MDENRSLTEETDQEFVARLTALSEASAYGEGARNDFGNCVAENIDRIIELAKRCVRKTPGTEDGRRRGGLARAASMTPDQRSDIARKAAQARWGQTPKGIP